MADAGSSSSSTKRLAVGKALQAPAMCLAPLSSAPAISSAVTLMVPPSASTLATPLLKDKKKKHKVKKPKDSGDAAFSALLNQPKNPPEKILASPARDRQVTSVLISSSSEEASVASRISVATAPAQLASKDLPPVPPSYQR